MQAARRAPDSLLFCALAGGVAAVLGVITLDRRSLWMDEAIDVSLSGLAWGDYIRTAFQQEGSQALYLLLLKPWLALTSTDEWVARLPSVVFAASAAALLVALGVRLFHSRLVGLGAGLLLATNAMSVSWSQQVRQYALAMFLAVLVTFLFAYALESESARYWLIYGAVAGISVYAHFFVGLVVASHTFALLSSWDRRTLRRWAIAAAAMIVLALPAVDFVLNHNTGQVSWIQTLTYEHVRSAVHQASGHSWLLLAVGAAALLSLVFETFRAPGLAWRHLLVASWLVVPLGLAATISYFNPILVERYLIVSLPALALAVAHVLSRLGPIAASVAVAALIAANLTHVRDWYRSGYGEDWRGAVHYVEQERRTNDQVLAYPGWLSPPVVYYANSPVDVSETPTANRAWVVTFVDRVAEAESWVAETGYRIAGRLNFGQIWILLLTKSSPT